MKIIADLPEYLVQDIRQLIKDGKYSSISSFFMTSVENQLSLEAGVDTEQLENSVMHGKNTNRVISPNFDKLRLNNLKSLKYMPPPKSNLLIVSGKNSINEDWMWGQINRILPIKFSIRMLANILSTREDNINLKSFEDKVRPIARDFGKYLLELDIEADRKRDQRFSVGFPIGENYEKALARFSDQFIAYARKDGCLSGALPTLRFANIVKNANGFEIGITKAGSDFAAIENPVIDKLSFEKSLCDKEIDYYLKHIIKNVPGEQQAFKAILDIMQNGTNTREGINKILLLDLEPQHKWGSDVLNTQRSGAMSRMYELRLISKEKTGIYVTYAVTEKGKDFLSMCK